MGNEIVLTGIVLLAAPANEYDKRMEILTKERGKITAFAKGAKRPKSQLAAGTRPFSFGKFTLYEGKSAYNLVSVEIQNYFEEITMDMEAVWYGFYFLEVAQYFTTENMQAEQELYLLYQSLRALLNKNLENRLVRRIFELKMLAIHGEYPDVFECMQCGAKEALDGFSQGRNGTLCRNCHTEDKISLEESTIYSMQYVITAPVGKLYTFCVTPEVLKELGMVINRFMQAHVEKEFNSALMLKNT